MSDSWLDKPNLMGDRKKLEELCTTDIGKKMAALGAIGAALNEAHAQPAKPSFFYPTSRQYPFDETTFKIVEALMERNFSVPGIEVEIHSYGPNKSYKHVSTIKSDDFRLWFCRGQGRINPHWNDTAAVNQLNIPGKELSVFEDYSGPRFYLYVGDNWEKDKEDFVIGSKVNSKLHGERKTYLHFTGSQEKDKVVNYDNSIAPFLTHDNDLGREYDPEGDEPTYFKTKEVFKEFKDFLENRLKEIRKT